MKGIRLWIVRMVSSAMGVPVRIADDFWVTDNAPSTKSPLLDGNSSQPN